MRTARRMILLGVTAAILAGSVMAARPVQANPVNAIGGIKLDNALPTDPVQFSPSNLDLGMLEADETRTANLTVVSPTDGSVTAVIAGDAIFQVERITSYKYKWVRVGAGIMASWERVKVVDQSVAGYAPIPVKAQQELVVVVRGTGLDNGERSATLTVAGGTLWRIKVPVRATVWGSSHEVYHFNGSEFVRIPGSLRQVAVGRQSFVWGVNDRDEVFRFNPDTRRFERFPNSPNLHEIVVGPAGGVWGLTRYGEIYRLHKEGAPWYFAAIPGRLSQIAIGGMAPYELVYGVNAAGEVYWFNPYTERFERKPGQLYQIAVTESGRVWGLGEVNQSNGDLNLGHPGRTIYAETWNPGTNSFSFEPVAGSLAQITLSGEGDPWGINGRGEIFRWDSKEDKFVQVPGSLTQIAGWQMQVWGINSAGEIYMLDWELRWRYFERVPGQLSRIAVGQFTGRITDVWGIRDVPAYRP